MSEEVYVVLDEPSGERYVFENIEDAREANSVGHWSNRALYPATLNPDSEDVGVTDE